MTVALVRIVRCRVGVYSTINGTATAAAAPTPKPTTKRSAANSTQAPSGIMRNRAGAEAHSGHPGDHQMLASQAIRQRAPGQRPDNRADAGAEQA